MRLFRKREEKITPEVSDVLLRALINNEVITREKAMTLPAVSGAVDLISSAIASMPIKLYKEIKGRVEEVTGDPRVRFLNLDTEDTFNGFQWKKMMVEDYLLGKGGYSYIRRFRNEVTGLFYVEDSRITIEKNFKPIYKNYAILVEGQRYKPFEFIKLLRDTRDGSEGRGLTEEISKVLETAYASLLLELKRAKTGGAKKGFLKSKSRLAKEEIDTLKEAWRRLYGDGSENIVILNNGVEFEEASASSVEMQMNESAKRLSDQINNVFHISDDWNQTFKLAIYPVMKAFEAALNRDLLLEKEKDRRFFSFDDKEIIRTDLKDRYESYKLAKETGFMTLNEIRRAENMNHIEGLDVINVGLGAVLYDAEKQVYFTPNTDTISSIEDAEPATPQTGADPQQENDMIEAHEEEQAFEESGNSSD